MVSEVNPLKHKKKQYVKRADGWYFKPEFLGQREFKIEDKNLLTELNGKVDPNVLPDLNLAPSLEAPVVNTETATDNVYKTDKEFEELKEKEELESSKKNKLNTKLNNGMDAYDDPENKKELTKKNEEEVKEVYGYWEDDGQGGRVYIPGKYNYEEKKMFSGTDNVQKHLKDQANQGNDVKK